MPEGDTIYKVAHYMAPLLQNHRLLDVTAAHTRLSDLAGRRVERVHAAGKHLLIHCSGWVLRVHLGMHGSWHRYAPAERWQRRGSISLVLRTASDVFVCFNAEDIACLRPPELSRSVVAMLGPDLLGETCDLKEVLRRARRRPPESPMVDILLDQRIAAGLGNVYKCELLYMFALHPMTPVGQIDDAALEAIFARGRELLLANVGGWERTTTYDRRQGHRPGVARLYIYGKRHVHCDACQTRIEEAIMGQTRRNTFWCPTCQPTIAP